MLNYIRAELYKAARRPFLWIMLGLLLAGETLLIWILWESGQEGGAKSFFSWVQIVPRMLELGVFAAMLTTDLVFAGQYKNGTMKNEVSFGIPRHTIFCGKLFAMSIVSVAIMLVAMVYYTGGCWLLAGQREGAPAAVAYLALSLLAALPIWLGMQALNCALCFLLSSGMAAELIVLGVFFGTSTVLAYLALLMSSGGNTAPLELANKITPWLPDKALLMAYIVALVDWDTLTITHISWGLMRQCWLVGAFWAAVPTALGLYGFHRKEIK